jgi:hypothetical protein
MTYHLMATSGKVVDDVPLLDELLEPYRKGLGPGYLGYRAHCYRMVNWARFTSADVPYRNEKLAIMTVYHDIPYFVSGDLDYIDKACDLADAYLDDIDRGDWKEEMRLMISNHHKVRAYTGPHANLVDACRKADWIDVSFTKLRYGIDKGLVKEVRATFPMNEAYKAIAIPGIMRYAKANLSRPLPMMRW